MSSRKSIKSALESMMFIWGKPLEAKEAADVFNVDKKEIRECFLELKEEYEQEGRGIVIREVNGAFQFTTRPDNLPYIQRLCTPVRHRRLSQSALETLAIVAYRQPVTRLDIEKIRGVKSDYSINQLIEFGLICEKGRMDAPGKPLLFGTTADFLRHFGFESIDDMPTFGREDLERFRAEATHEAGGGPESEPAEEVSV